MEKGEGGIGEGEGDMEKREREREDGVKHDRRSLRFNTSTNLCPYFIYSHLTDPLQYHCVVLCILLCSCACPRCCNRRVHHYLLSTCN